MILSPEFEYFVVSDGEPMVVAGPFKCRKHVFKQLELFKDAYPERLFIVERERVLRDRL